MKHFLQIASGLDTLPTLNGLRTHAELWNAHTLRTSHPQSAHSEVSDIWVFFNELKGDGQSVVNDLDVRPYRAWSKLPSLRPIVFGLMRQVEGVRLGRVIITSMRPGARIAPHTDGGAPASYFTRYQVALQSLPGATFRCEDEIVQFATGSVWRVNNRVEHEVQNDSADDRIVMIVDIRHE